VQNEKPKEGLLHTERISSESACALLHQLAELNLKIGAVSTVRRGTKDDLDEWAESEQRIIVELLTELRGRHPLDEEIQAATAM